MKTNIILFFLTSFSLFVSILLGISRELDNKIVAFVILSNLSLLIFIGIYVNRIGFNFLIFILAILILNNLILSVFRLFYNIIPLHYSLKQRIGNILGNYVKYFYVHPNLFLRKLYSNLIKILDLVNNRLNVLLHDLMFTKPLTLLHKEKDFVSKHTLLTFENNLLLDHTHLLGALFKGLCLEEEFKTPGKKIVVVVAVRPDFTYFIHKNIVIDENTTVNTYLEKIAYNIKQLYESGYPLTEFPILQVKLWKINQSGERKITKEIPIKLKRCYHTNTNKTNKSLKLIKPLKTPKTLNKKLIGAIDIETIEFNNNNQLPISISFSYFNKDELITIFELINYNLLLLNPDEAVKSLWLCFKNKLAGLNLHNYVIFSHNLGSFDGYFIFKGLLNQPEINIDSVTSIIDELHRFISINWEDCKIVYKDSYRLFPVSLSDLAEIFEVEGKLQDYNPSFNKISLFENENLLAQFIKYSKQDSICLLKALMKAQDIYLEEHKVDIASIWSTSTLSFKIFRQKFLECDIPILTQTMDKIIRLAYIGGSTDYFLKYGENLKHYDVNSLYPKAMCNPMPIQFTGITYGPNIKLDEVFGFAEARVTTPDNLEIPLLPLKLDSETIHPLGSWIGLYFTEELKAVVEQGYKIELIKVYNFTQENLFYKYIEYFYNIKKNSTGAMKFIAKRHLNTLYGYFGRRTTLIETKNVYTKDLIKYYGSHTIFSEIKINDSISTVLMSSNLDYDLINEIREETNLDITSSFRSIKSHVGIAAAVTSYARIEMIKYKTLLSKLGIKLYYTDTDSMFINDELPKHLVGSELGQMKDELDGGYIKKAYFLGIKKYGYVDNKEFVHSVFSGVERDSLTWEEIEQISKGVKLIKPSPARFYKNLNNLDIKIKNSLNTTIKFKTKKTLSNNTYLPLKINLKYLIKLDYYLKIVKDRIINLLKKYNNLKSGCK